MHHPDGPAEPVAHHHTIAETVSDFDVDSWLGLVGSARMPSEAIRRIEQDMARLVSDRLFPQAFYTSSIPKHLSRQRRHP